MGRILECDLIYYEVFVEIEAVGMESMNKQPTNRDDGGEGGMRYGGMYLNFPAYCAIFS